jgi:hypothetical protein
MLGYQHIGRQGTPFQRDVPSAGRKLYFSDPLTALFDDTSGSDVPGTQANALTANYYFGGQ